MKPNFIKQDSVTIPFFLTDTSHICFHIVYVHDTGGPKKIEISETTVPSSSYLFRSSLVKSFKRLLFYYI